MFNGVDTVALAWTIWNTLPYAFGAFVLYTLARVIGKHFIRERKRNIFFDSRYF